MNIPAQKLKAALAGAANVGKSVVFNQLTGSHQHIGNWPGKTIEKAEGTLYYRGYTVDILDLPGISSLSSYSIEELITRNYILQEHPDFIINLLDATHLETNLILTLQLLELEQPILLTLNMSDLVKKRGVDINHDKLAALLGIPVIPTIATYGKGLSEILDAGIYLFRQQKTPTPLRYGKEIEIRITKLSEILKNTKNSYPKRFIAIKLLEKDEEIVSIIEKTAPEIVKEAKKLCLELEEIHGHSSDIVIADERCILAAHLAREVTTIDKPQRRNFEDILNEMTSHKILGYPLMALILGSIFLLIFQGGSTFSSWLDTVLTKITLSYQQNIDSSFIASLALSGLISTFSLISLVISFVLPFYFLLFNLESTGYLARVSYLMDNVMHKLGVHGKACIPLILGLGCNVPACLSCRIMETQRERFITGLLAAFVPCSAVTILIAGLAGKFLGIKYVIILYTLIFLMILLLGRIASLVTPGEPTELIMTMPSYKIPSFKAVIKHTWIKLREFIYIVVPIVVLSGIAVDAAYQLNFLSHFNNWLKPLTTNWLGLPQEVGILLILGIIRKELILVILASILGTTNFASVLTPVQLFVLALVSALYIPCVATIATLYKEFGWQKATLITMLKITLALVVGGVVSRIFTFFY